MTAELISIKPNPPEPTPDNPHAQLEWLCGRYIRRYNNKQSIQSVQSAVKAYETFLKETGGYDENLLKDPRFHLLKHWDQYFLLHAEGYWRSKGKSSHTIYKRIQILRNLFDFAVADQLTATTFVIVPNSIYPVRETPQREAYEDEELAFISTIITPAVEWAKTLVAGYKPTGIGEDPLKKLALKKAASTELRQQADSSSVWQWENIVWYFENVLNCEAIRKTEANLSKHGQFFHGAVSQYGSMEFVWRKLGVSPLIDADLMFPLAMKLCWETGLNPEVLANLRRDCFQPSHPLTGLPYLRYFKERSTGEKELHLTLLDSNDGGEVPLTRKQSLVVQRTIELIRQLTEPLVSLANEEDKDLLLIYQLNSPRGRKRGGVSRLIMKYISVWMCNLRASRGEGDEAVPPFINMSRFRATKITQMVREGRDICEIQAAVGHASVTTTSKYLSENRIAPIARREVSQTLQVIHENRVKFERNPLPYASGKDQSHADVIYKGVLCDCKNIYDPPLSVRRLPVYKEGQACSYFNMCLLCPNVIITRSHLPRLLTYRLEIKAALSDHNLRDAPHWAHYEKSLAVIEGALWEFDEKDIKWAEEIAESADYFLDSVTYRGAEDDD